MKLPERLHGVLADLRQHGARLVGRLQKGDARALTQLLRPNLGPTPSSLRRVLEPVVALSALTLLLSLFSVGAFSFAVLFIVGGLIYAILTYVFGIELALAT